MRKFYGPPIPGSISPVPATEEMTEPVGIKDGQLWTKGPDGGLEERVETLETDVGNLQETAIEHGTDIDQLEFDVEQAEGDIVALGTSKQDKYLAMSVELPSTDWVIDDVSGFNITVNVSGVTSSKLVQVTPGVSTISDYLDAGVYCSAQGNGTLTFHSDDSQPPSVSLYANVVIWG